MNYKKTHSQTLLPMLNEIKKMIDLDLNSIDYIAVAAGPGSFTGLRIGSATVKGMGQKILKTFNSDISAQATADGAEAMSSTRKRTLSSSMAKRYFYTHHGVATALLSEK